MSTREAFLAAIDETPGDDAPRLVFADWLEENGQPERAELIRLQCRLAATDRYDPQRRPLVRRERELLRRFGKRWVREDGLDAWIDPDGLGHHPVKIRYRRGFVESAWFISPDAYLRAAESVCRLTPLREVSLWAPYTFASPEDTQRAQQTYMRLWGEAWGFVTPGYEGAAPDFPEPEEFRRLVASPWFARLAGFGMDTIFSDRRHLEVLLSGPATANLRELDLSGNPLLVGQAWAPFAGVSLPNLESLALDRCNLGTAGLQAVVGSPGLVNLRRLRLRGERWPFEAEGFRVLTAPGRLPRLEALSLYAQRGGAEGLGVLAAWPGLGGLAKLDLSYNYHHRDESGPYLGALDAFVHSPHWRLRELDLDGDSLEPGGLEGLEILTSARNVSTLRVLTLDARFSRGDDRPAQDEAAALLVRCPYLADDLELHLNQGHLSRQARRLLRDRFGDGLVLYPADGLQHRLAD